ncbi:MAG: hypothetical protein SGJ27_18985 [Candidatus Melainabacteria bacterium]|nr:hypothetical protein [Candidatus Melainabacteria bacterium]
MKITSPKASFLSRTLAIAALLLGASDLSAYAAHEDKVSFREFRQQFEGIDRNAARKMFHQQFGRPDNNNNKPQIQAITPYQNIITVGANGQAVCGGDIAGRNNKALRENRIKNQSVQELTNGSLTRVNRGVDLDLSSNNRNIVLGKGLFGTNGGAVEISVGGKNASYQAGSVVTAAEYVAVKQALDGGQKVEVDRAGRAIGGTVDLGSLTSGNAVMKASNLVIPDNVTTYGDFGKGSDFRLNGELSNYGTVQVLSSDKAIKGGAIRAEDISNHSGALISSTVNVHLDAARNLTNYGDILSTEGLTISAGNELNNAGRIASNGALNINAARTNNSGVMSSSSANVNLASAVDLVVNNHKGTIAAVNGAINVRDASYIGSGNSYVNGGDLISLDLNLNSGHGTANVNVNDLTGNINGTGTASHVTASTDLLKVGNVCLTGDPTFYNTAGGILINDDVIVAEDLVFIATGGIATTEGVEIRAGDATKGYNITFISGATITSVSGGASQPIIGPVSGLPPYANSGTVTISAKASKNAAGVDFGLNTVVSSRSTDIANDRDGGNISIFAFGKSGLIDAGSARLESGGQKLGSGGDITMATGASSPDLYSIVTGAIDTTNQVGGPQGVGGDVLLVTAAPVIIGGKSVTYDDKGALVGPASLEAGPKLAKGDILFNSNGSIIGGTDVKVAGQIEAYSGNTLEIRNTVEASEATLSADFAQRTFDAGNVVAGAVSLQTGKGGFIGTGPVDGMVIDTNSLNINSPRGFASILGTGTGVLDLNSTGGTILIVDSPLQEIQGTAQASSTVVLRGDKINPTGNVSSGDVLSLVSITAPLVNTDPTQYGSEYLILSAPTIGTSVGSPFQLNENVQQVDVFQSGTAFINSNAPKSILIGDVDVTGNFTFRSNSGIELGIDSVSVFQTGGKLDIATTAGTVQVNDDVQVAAVTEISILNTGTSKKDKILFGENSRITTAAAGDITIGLGTQGVPVVPTFTNPVLSTVGTGTITFFGNALSAKGADSSIEANDAAVVIFNSVNAKNVGLEGNVSILTSSQ